MNDPVISSDSHIFEPGDLWHTRVDRRWREVAPRVVELDGGGEAMRFDDGTLMHYVGFGSAGDRGCLFELSAQIAGRLRRVRVRSQCSGRVPSRIARITGRFDITPGTGL
jgi:hypothetical protein